MMDDVSCAGDEKSIFLCEYNPENNCGHSEDVSVMCEERIPKSMYI